MATIEWALRRTTVRTYTPADDFDWTRPPGSPRRGPMALVATALHRERERAAIDMASLEVGRETGVR